MVGDEMFRGISGGQRKRVTAGTDITTNNYVLDSELWNFPLPAWWYLSTACRWDISRFSESIVHGRDLQWAWQLHNIPDYQLSQTGHSHPQWNSSHLLATACTRDIQLVWWHPTPLRWPDCVPWAPWGCSWFLWVHGVQMPWQKGCRWFLARSMTNWTMILLLTFMYNS